MNLNVEDSIVKVTCLTQALRGRLDGVAALYIGHAQAWSDASLSPVPEEKKQNQKNIFPLGLHVKMNQIWDHVLYRTLYSWFTLCRNYNVS